MYRLSQIIFVLIFFPVVIFSQNPHGKDMKIDCAQCHTSDSWNVDFRNIEFDHNSTSFSLYGRHRLVDCRECHRSLILSNVKNECVDCHTDIHKNTLSMQCNNCHSEDDWLINDIQSMHEIAGFPFTDAHIGLDCRLCHNSSVELVFEPLPVDCYSCHAVNYQSVLEPNHAEENFPLDCNQCHDINATTWLISHDFFPLEKGHAFSDCFTCHTDGNYQNLSADCVSCHIDNYEKASNPDHVSSSFSKECTECHTIDPGWAPAEYKEHDENSFPVYSGKHEGEWTLCTDCHIDPGNYSVFTCIDCHEHEKSKMDEEHDEESGYVYESQACFKCHPDGDK